MTISKNSSIRVGIVGVGGRGGSYILPMVKLGARITAICDSREEAALARLTDAQGARIFTSWEQMLDYGEFEALVIGTPMPSHARLSIAALQRGFHVLCEVPAAVSVEECRELTLVASQSKSLYMMAENYGLTKSNLLVNQLVQAGLFGTAYYAEGEYLHDVREYALKTPWRRQWQLGIDGLTYSTHSLAPLLQWMGNTRLTRVSCAAAGTRYFDEEGKSYQQASPVMLGLTAGDGLVKVRVDLVTARPHAMTNYQLQGTEGVYESSRGAPGDQDRIWLQKLSKDPKWFEIRELLQQQEFRQQYMPRVWEDPTLDLDHAGHEGTDVLISKAFLEAIQGRANHGCGIHHAMDLTLPGLFSQQSIAMESQWLEVPDSRLWVTPSRPQLQMIFPRESLPGLSGVKLDAGYEVGLAGTDDYLAVRRVVKDSGLAEWDEKSYRQIYQSVLPGGHFVVRHKATQQIVATAMAQHRPMALHPQGGEVGWVAADPAHMGKGLGAAVVAAAARRLVHAGYERIYLQTDDHRLPAIWVYLKLGFVPLMCDPQMPERWSSIRKQLGI